MKNRPTSPFLRALDALLEGRTGSCVINIFIIPAMILLALILPPLALPQRILSAGYTGISPNAGGSVSLSDGTFFSIPAGALKSGSEIKLNSMTPDAFARDSAAQSLPPTLDVKSPAYEPGIQGAAPSLSILSIPIPDNSDPYTTLDVYGYDGKNWAKLPFQLYPNDQRIEAYLPTLPRMVVIAQTQAQVPTISADLSSASPLPSQATSLVAEVNPVGLTIADGGGIAGNVPQLPATSASSPYQVVPTVSDWDGTQTRGDLVENMITDAATREQHVQALVDLAVEKLYPGLNVDYQGVNANNRSDFTAFVSQLAAALHAKDKILSVTLPLPDQVAADTWQTGAYDWDAIGHAADIVKIPLPTAHEAYAGDNPPVDQYLQWAVGHVDRFKLEITFSAMGRDEFGSSFAPIGFTNAAALMGPIDAPDTIAPGAKAPLDLPKLREAGGVKLDEASGLYSFGYKDDKGQSHTVWLESANSFAKKVALAQDYNLRGVALRDLSDDAVESRAWNVFNEYHNSQALAFKGSLTIAWRVNGQTVGKVPATDPRFTWTATTDTGGAKIEATLSFDDGQTVAANVANTDIQVEKLVVAAPTVAPVAAGPKPTPKPAAPSAPASTFTGQNLFGYGAQLNWTNSDNNAEMGQLNQLGFKWAKVQIRWCDLESSRGVADLSQVDRLIGAANSHGIKVLFSVVCAPNWSRADGGAGGSGPPDNMQDAANFMSGLASKYCNGGLGAIEVWNEHNLLTEWHGKPISAALYMDMLKKSYTAIKAKCPSVVVVSGAPTPTGVVSDTAIDDVLFLQQLYQNGLKDYSDAIGVHPSGFCNAPDVSVGAMNNCGGQYNNHRSFFFKDTMTTYHQVMSDYGDTKKQLWPTEFGWGVDGSPKPGYDYEKFISEQNQADWLVKAYQQMRAWGWVGVATLWNLDFTDMNNETGAFHVVGRPAFNSLAGMPK
ncbi:MAG: glycosyl hydrolase family 18 protein [Chloroflexi bacterium]|nr:glycosyl hydrolase family 18 protein [Chloroflexota bacterium]